jgi:hypothetical protein
MVRNLCLNDGRSIEGHARFGDYHLTDNPSYVVSDAGQLHADQTKVEF